MTKLKIAMCQTNFMVGDIAANARKIIDLYNATDADLIVFPELALSGYHCMDLFLNRSFLREVHEQLDKIVVETGDKAILLGTPLLTTDKNNIFPNAGHPIAHNSAIVIQNGKIKHQYNKFHLPNNGVFDERRHFIPGDKYTSIFEIKGLKIRLLICEDLWNCDTPISDHESAACTITINASPFSINKALCRRNTASEFITRHQQGPLVYLNALGGQDHLVFDGGSFVMDQNGDYIISPKLSCEEVISFELSFSSNQASETKRDTSVIVGGNRKDSSPTVRNLHVDSSQGLQNVYQAILLGLRDYARYANCHKFILGLSGGIDSALVATIAVDAFGAESVLCVAMPSKYSSQASLDDAAELARNLGCEMVTVPVQSIKQLFDSTLENVIGKLAEDELTNENLQPRIRSNILMAIANKQSRLLLCTSNKSESAVGYTTLYGDMTGAFAPIIDLYKTQVYALSNWRNKNVPHNSVSEFIVQGLDLIPINIIEKAPSAELKYNQKDSDSLPEYDVLDNILFSLLEEKIDTEVISNRYKVGVQEIERIQKLIAQSEFKRFQSPPGVKINHTMLSNDRRYPICKKTLFA